MRSLHTTRYCTVFAILVALVGSSLAVAGGTAITYQGRLMNDGAAFDGDVAMEFSLWDAPVGGVQQGPTLAFAVVEVVDGLFTVELDFGTTPHTANDDRWLEVLVDDTPLSARQRLTATPFALNTRGLNVDDSGKVGIGTAAPSHLFHAETTGTDSLSALTAMFRSASTIGTWLNLGNASPGGRFWRMISTGSANSEGAGKLLIGHGTSAGGSAVTMTLQNNNKVGIGTVNPGSVITNSKLDVVGGHIAVGNDFGIFSMNSINSGLGAGFDTTSNDALEFYSNGARRMTIAANGNVGINTTSASAPLTFRNRDEPKIAFWQSPAPNGFYGFGMAVGGRVQATAGIRGSFEIGHDDGSGGFTERMRVHTNGRVGIGTASPSQALHVIGNIQASGNMLASCGVLLCSDQRFKTKVEPVGDALSLVEKLRPVRYDWKREAFPDRKFTDDRQLGLIAQEVRKIAPELVQQDNEGYLAVDYARITPLLVQALKQVRSEKDSQVAELQAANDALQSRLDRIESMLRESAN